MRLYGRQAMRGKDPLTGPLKVSVLAIFLAPASWTKSKKALAYGGELAHVVKPDADNVGKTIDALNKIVWADDSQIVSMLVEKRYGMQPKMVIHVEEAVCAPAI